MTYYNLNSIISEIKVFQNYAIIYCIIDNNRIPLAKVNSSAYEILRLCNGRNTKENIIEELVKKYNDKERVKNFVDNYIEESRKLALIVEKKDIEESSKVITVDLSQKVIPELISLELTKNCPLLCKHCYLGAGEENHINNNMDSHLLWNICQEIVDLGIKNVQLTGGEPLLHNDIFDIIEFLQNNNVAVQLFTSGYLNSQIIIDRLSDFKGNNLAIQVSLDGLLNFHNEFRGRDDAYQRSIGFIRKLIERSIKVIVGVSILNQSDEEVLELTRVIKELGVSSVRLGFVSDRGRAHENNLSQESGGIERVKYLQRLLVSKWGDDKFRIELSEDFDKVNTCGNCGLGQLVLKIDYKGDIYPCIMSDLKIGNYNDTNIDKIQHRYSKIFSKVKSPITESCKKCDKFFLCKFCIIEAMMYCSQEKEWYKQNMHLIDKVRSI